MGLGCGGFKAPACQIYDALGLKATSCYLHEARQQYGRRLRRSCRCCPSGAGGGGGGGVTGSVAAAVAVVLQLATADIVALVFLLLS